MQSFDFAVVGSGVAGLATALGFAQQGASVALVGPRPVISTGAARPADAPFDTRIYAVSPASAALLTRLGVWPQIDVARLQAVLRMRVFGDDGDELAFDAYAAHVERLATIAEESELLRVLDTACDYQPALRRLEAPFAALPEHDARGATLGLADGSSLRAGLVVGADGAQSAVRAAAGIAATVKAYGQTGVVANFRAGVPHRGMAWQWFTGEGIVALLPLAGDAVSLVWSAPDALAQQLLALAPAELAARVDLRTNGQLGPLQAVGPAAGFALRRIDVQTLAQPGLALVGDAAHVVHPLAGQGLNLGLGDVAALLDVQAAREPVRAPGDAVLLRRYVRARAEPVALMRLTTDGLARLFARDDALTRRLRNAGLSALDALTPAKQLLMRAALG